MAISHVGVGNNFSVTTSGTSYQFNCPTGVQDGDVLIAFMAWEGSDVAALTPHDGWTTIATVPINDGTDDWTLFIAAKDGTAADDGFSFTTANSNGSVSVASTRRSSKVLAYRDAAPIADQTWSASHATTNTGTTGGATQTINNPSSNNWVIAFFGFHDNTTGTWGSYTGNATTERYELSNGGADPFMVHAVTDSNGTVAAGNVNATGNPSITEDNTIVWIGIIAAAVPDPIGGSLHVVKRGIERASIW